MRETILNNKKSFNVFNKLILNGFYSGTISPDRIEFEREKTPSILTVNNYRIIGTLNSEKKLNLISIINFQ